MNKKLSGGNSFETAKDYSLKYLSYRPRTVKEVKNKLAEKGFTTEVIISVITFLKEYKFVDDDAFARMWIKNRITLKPMGRRRIINELYQKGLDKATIERNISSLPTENEEAMAAQLVEKKLSRSEFKYNKLEAFLARRGFSSGIIQNVLGSYHNLK